MDERHRFAVVHTCILAGCMYITGGTHPVVTALGYALGLVVSGVVIELFREPDQSGTDGG